MLKHQCICCFYLDWLIRNDLCAMGGMLSVIIFPWVYSLVLCVHCLFQLSENQIADRDILTVFAEDKDGGSDGTVTYSISGKIEMVNDTRKRLISAFVIHLFERIIS